jgi:hypothetical protein
MHAMDKELVELKKDVVEALKERKRKKSAASSEPSTDEVGNASSLQEQEA